MGGIWEKVRSRLTRLLWPGASPEVDISLRRMLELTNERNEPNINDLWRLTKDLEALRWNVKAMGYEVARLRQQQLMTRDVAEPTYHGLQSQASTQADIESDWYIYWCKQMCAAPVYHRKMWEFAYVMQAFYEMGVLAPGASVLGFGVGFEPLPSYFASIGMNVLATDLPQEDMAERGWRDGASILSEMQEIHNSAICDWEIFQTHVGYRAVDMNDIPVNLNGYDACWSCCSLEHVGSIAKGLDFIANSLRTLKPGGVAVHTTEYNFANPAETIDNWGTVLFQRQHFEAIAQRLREQGHWVAPLNFNVGDQPLDRFIDIPPFELADDDAVKALWGGAWQANHLKLVIDGFASTSYGLIIRKRES